MYASSFTNDYNACDTMSFSYRVVWRDGDASVSSRFGSKLPHLC